MSDISAVPPTSTEKEKPAGLDNSFNHDLKASQAFVDSYPRLAEGLKDERLIKSFDYFEGLARKYKSRFHTLGLWSLIFGAIPLVAAAIRMTVGEALFKRAANINPFVELAGLASIALLFWNRRARNRVLWCQAVFCRERLRQWHFQRFLDGQLIKMLDTDKVAYKKELDRRWDDLQQNLKDGYGMMVEFTRFSSREINFFHHATAYDDPVLFKTAIGALWTLRVEHQLRFSRRKIETEGEQAGLALEERTAISETIASVTLAAAIVVSALALVMSAWQKLWPSEWILVQQAPVGRSLSGIALILAVLSAASRAYRAGYTLPDESESYEEYCDRVRELKALLSSAATDTYRLRYLEQLEDEATAELRRFLRMKTRATFVS